MGNTRSYTTADLGKFSVGVQDIFDDILGKKHSTYPPYNLIEVDKDNYVIELAVAGFKPEELTVQTEQTKLIISGKKEETKDKVGVYTYNGISNRNFFHSYLLPLYARISDVQLEHGILTVKITREVPEAEKPKTYSITYNK